MDKCAVVNVCTFTQACGEMGLNKAGQYVAKDCLYEVRGVTLRHPKNYLICYSKSMILSEPWTWSVSPLVWSALMSAGKGNRPCYWQLVKHSSTMVTLILRDFHDEREQNRIVPLDFLYLYHVKSKGISSSIHLDCSFWELYQWSVSAIFTLLWVL